MLAHIFAQKTIANLEPVIVKTLGILVAKIDKYVASAEEFNMRNHPHPHFSLPHMKDLQRSNLPQALLVPPSHA